MFGLIPFRMTRGNNTTISSLTDLFDNFFNRTKIVSVKEK